MMIKMLSCNYFKRQKQQLLKTSDCHSEAFKIICLVKYSGLAQFGRADGCDDSKVA